MMMETIRTNENIVVVAEFYTISSIFLPLLPVRTFFAFRFHYFPRSQTPHSSILACVIFGLIYVLIPPVQRGFFCDDTSIQYPFRHDTIPMWMLSIYGGLVPIIIVSESNLQKTWKTVEYFLLVLCGGTLGRSSICSCTRKK